MTTAAGCTRCHKPCTLQLLSEEKLGSVKFAAYIHVSTHAFAVQLEQTDRKCVSLSDPHYSPNNKVLVLTCVVAICAAELLTSALVARCLDLQVKAFELCFTRRLLKQHYFSALLGEVRLSCMVALKDMHVYVASNVTVEHRWDGESRTL